MTDVTKVLYSPGYGAGWYTWNRDIPECLTDPEIIAAVEAGELRRAGDLASEKWPKGYWGGAGQLKVKEIPKGTRYTIEEYDGSESFRFADSDEWMTA